MWGFPIRLFNRFFWVALKWCGDHFIVKKRALKFTCFFSSSCMGPSGVRRPLSPAPLLHLPCIYTTIPWKSNDYLVGGLEHEFYFSTYWEFHTPNWRTHICQRGRYTTNQLILPTTVKIAIQSVIGIFWEDIVHCGKPAGDIEMSTGRSVTSTVYVLWLPVL